MKLSRRAQAIAPFLAMEFGKKAAELDAAGHRVIRLNLGEPDFGAPTAVRATVIVKAEPICDHPAGLLQGLKAEAAHALVFEGSEQF
jgi:aspartate/methionine/tyrosine aminotransferase